MAAAPDEPRVDDAIKERQQQQHEDDVKQRQPRRRYLTQTRTQTLVNYAGHEACSTDSFIGHGDSKFCQYCENVPLCRTQCTLH